MSKNADAKPEADSAVDAVAEEALNTTAKQ
jgi:hypothetical protein